MASITGTLYDFSLEEHVPFFFSNTRTPALESLFSSFEQYQRTKYHNTELTYHLLVTCKNGRDGHKENRGYFGLV